MLKYLMLLIFVISTSIHLYASWHSNKPLRDKSKPFILLSLLGFYIFSAEKIALTVIIALILSWIGDLLLIPNGIKWFTAGGISFMFSHVFFIISYAKYVEFIKINKIMIVLLALAFIITVSIIFKKLKPFLPKPLFYPMYLYLLINGSMNCFAWFRSMTTTGLSSIITAIGAFLFFVSDSALFFVRFNASKRLTNHFLVMLTYSLGELLIVIGLL